MFIQIHTLTSYPASLLNRDDANLAKRIPFGNAIRLRVSSQCLKRHWREDLVDFETMTAKICEIPDGYRSRRIFELVFTELQKRNVPDDEAKILALCMKNLVMKSSSDSKDDDGNNKNEIDLRIKQPIFLSRPEVDFMVDIAEKIRKLTPDLNKALKLAEGIKKNDKLAREKRDFRDQLGLTEKNLQAMQKSAVGLSSALFGRMVTSDLLARVDAPVHVAHAFTVHAANTEMDYFTVVDDLNREDETGAAHANQTELGAGLFYGYVAIDVPLLVSNLTGSKVEEWKSQDATTPRRVIEALITSITQQSPGAKKGSTAPYALADLLLLEAGNTQPRTLANAFLDAVPWKDAKQDLRVIAMQRLSNYLNRLDQMYCNQNGYRGLSTTLDPVPPELPAPTAVADNIQAALDAVWS